MMYIPDVDYFVRVVDLPLPVGGVVTPNDDGTFSIYINGKRTDEQQMHSYLHEVSHIEDDDFYNDKPIEEIENKKTPTA